MKLIKTFFLILITLFLINFLSMNNAKVDIDLLFKKFDEVSISMVIFGSLSLGVLFGYIISKFRPNIKIILFLHLPISSSKLDFYFTKLISRQAFEIWADSRKTISTRSNELNIDKKISRKIISFIRFKNLPNNSNYKLYKNSTTDKNKSLSEHFNLINT